MEIQRGELKNLELHKSVEITKRSWEKLQLLNAKRHIRLASDKKPVRSNRQMCFDYTEFVNRYSTAAKTGHSCYSVVS